MLREFPGSLQRSPETVIPPRPSTSSASAYPPLYVSRGCKGAGVTLATVKTVKKKKKAMPKLKRLSCVQLQKNAGRHSDAKANTGVVSDPASGQNQHRGTAVLPTYVTQDRLTLVVLTLLLGGWLAIALSFPIVRRTLFISS